MPMAARFLALAALATGTIAQKRGTPTVSTQVRKALDAGGALVEFLARRTSRR